MGYKSRDPEKRMGVRQGSRVGDRRREKGESEVAGANSVSLLKGEKGY